MPRSLRRSSKQIGQHPRPSAMRGTQCVCGALKQPYQVACKRCWFSLPDELRSKIWKLYRNKETRGTPEHRDAVFEAIRILQEKKEAK